MEEYTFLAPLLLTIGGLIIGAILKSLLKHSRLPYTVGLFAIGIILGVMNRTGVFQSLPELHDAVSSGTHHLHAAHGHPHDGSSNLHPRF